jgi:hypothetical protein
MGFIGARRVEQNSAGVPAVAGPFLDHDPRLEEPVGSETDGITPLRAGRADADEVLWLGEVAGDALEDEPREAGPTVGSLHEHLQRLAGRSDRDELVEDRRGQ